MLKPILRKFSHHKKSAKVSGFSFAHRFDLPGSQLAHLRRRATNWSQCGRTSPLPDGMRVTASGICVMVSKVAGHDFVDDGEAGEVHQQEAEMAMRRSQSGFHPWVDSDRI